ncbi:hypothetical protein [Aeribacillus sp. FSL M8-0235]|uniref:hypothetical protein n=1 Tax=Aeribacillus sp. FSL M8-0235 TaxID=2954576 RepID=UPI0007B4CED5|nr:hypothetical protein A3Q35_13190 [Aeribacillus pallidus]
MVDNCKFDPQEVYDRKLQEDIDYWLPVIAGIATHEEVGRMTAEQLGVAISAAKMKIKLFGKGG